MTTDLRWKDFHEVERFERMLTRLGRNDAPLIYQRALSRTGDMVWTRVVRALTGQTGLKRKLLARAVRKTKPSWTNLTYRISASGGDIGLRYFDARETRKGVSAKPFNQRRVFQSTFMKGGRFPSRVELNMGGQVWQRVGSSRLPLMRATSGVIIPAEMVKDESAEQFEAASREILPRRVLHEINRATGGAFA
ncbi:MAG: hypothetical protein KKB37_11280 [Alphaproteobacteria bacterium]|nr:hypothetical protein [Alphaproteobacteria bacterium]